MKLETHLKDLRVHGPTAIGWDPDTPVNERVDAHGRPMPLDAEFGVSDPRAPARRMPHHPDVEALRNHLREHNGIRQLEIVAPDEVDRAVQITAETVSWSCAICWTPNTSHKCAMAVNANCERCSATSPSPADAMLQRPDGYLTGTAMAHPLRRDT